MKPDIVFFHEPLSYDFNRYLDEDKDKVDLLIVMGSSLKVEPVSNIMCKFILASSVDDQLSCGIYFG